MKVSAIGRELLGLEGKSLTAADYDVPQPNIYGGRRNKRISNNVAARHLQAYGGTEAVDWVMDNVRLIMETASNADYHFERDGEEFVAHRGPGDDGRKVKQAPQDLVELFESPNPWFTYVDMMELLIIDLLLVGNAFILKFKPNEKGQPIALYRLAPPLVTVIPGTTQLVERYEYKVPGEDPVSFAPEDVIHFKLPNPHDPYIGLGLIAGGPRVYDIELNLVETQASFFERGARWLGIITSDRTVPSTTIRKVRRMVAGLYGGPTNSGVVPILERGLTFQSISADAQQGGFEPLTNLSRNRINSHFRTSRALFGDVEGLDAKMVREAQRVFDNKTMRPLLNRIQERLSVSLTRAWDLDYVNDYEYTMAPEDAIDLATGMATLPGVKVKEVRQMAGLDPLGDERDDVVLNLPGDNTNASNVKDRNLQGEAGRPPNPENTAAFPDPGQPMPADAQAQGPQRAVGRRSVRRAQGKETTPGYAR